MEKIVSQMTLEEKAALSSGETFWTTHPIERLGVPSVLMTDGPHGLRKEKGADSGKGGVNIMKGSEPSTCFPPAVIMASTWDTDLIRRVGTAIGEEARDQGISTVLGPGTNIKRSPLCGRNFEYFSEDPYLAGEMSSNYVGGMQSTGIGCSLKHFCGNNQEFFRMSIDSVIDERTLREIYLPAFEKTVKKEQPYQIMCSYNRLNGTYLSDNKRMLTDVLRDEWGFRGIVVSDWGAVNDRVEGVKAGLDLQMPGDKGFSANTLVKAVKEGRLDEKDLDKTTARILEYVFKCDKNKGKKAADYAAHHKLCREAGAKGAVLLKNDEKMLPLSDEKIAVIGKLAEVSRYQGAGSSRIECKSLVNVLQALHNAGKQFDYAEGYTLKGDGRNPKLLAQAIETAKGKDKVVLVIGLTDIYESEGFDRTHMDLPAGHNELVEEILKVNPNVIVVLEGGSPVALPWRKEVKAILNTYLLGEAVGESTVDLLYGAVSPGGKLAETYPLALDDVLAQKTFPMGPKTVEYREGIFVGYRYFDSAKKEVAYPFGFGLSYTTFDVKNIRCADCYRGGTLTVECDVTNTGDREGSEVVQVYVRQNNAPVFKAEKELKGFARVYLNAGETKHVSIALNERSFAFYNTALSDWTILPGAYDILVGTSSRDILGICPLAVEVPEAAALPDYSEKVKEVYGHIGDVKEVDAATFEELYGQKLPDNTPYQRGEFHQNCTLTDVSCTKFGRRLCKFMQFCGKLVAGDAANAAMVVNTMTSIPLRAFCGFSGGILSPYSVRGLVAVFNKSGHGWRTFFRGFLKKYKNL